MRHIPLVVESYHWMASGPGHMASVEEIRMGPVDGVPEVSEKRVMTHMMWLTAFAEMDVGTSVEAATWGQIKEAFGFCPLSCL